MTTYEQQPFREQDLNTVCRLDSLFGNVRLLLDKFSPSEPSLPTLKQMLNECSEMIQTFSLNVAETRLLMQVVDNRQPTHFLTYIVRPWLWRVKSNTIDNAYKKCDSIVKKCESVITMKNNEQFDAPQLAAYTTLSRLLAQLWQNRRNPTELNKPLFNVKQSLTDLLKLLKDELTKHTDALKNATGYNNPRDDILGTKAPRTYDFGSGLPYLSPKNDILATMVEYHWLYSLSKPSFNPRTYVALLNAQNYNSFKDKIRTDAQTMFNAVTKNMIMTITGNEQKYIFPTFDLLIPYDTPETLSELRTIFQANTNVTVGSSNTRAVSCKIFLNNTEVPCIWKTYQTTIVQKTADMLERNHKIQQLDVGYLAVSVFFQPVDTETWSAILLTSDSTASIGSSFSQQVSWRHKAWSVCRSLLISWYNAKTNVDTTSNALAGAVGSVSRSGVGSINAQQALQAAEAAAASKSMIGTFFNIPTVLLVGGISYMMLANAGWLDTTQLKDGMYDTLSNLTSWENVKYAASSVYNMLGNISIFHVIATIKRYICPVPDYILYFIWVVANYLYHRNRVGLTKKLVYYGSSGVIMLAINHLLDMFCSSPSIDMDTHTVETQVINGTAISSNRKGPINNSSVDMIVNSEETSGVAELLTSNGTPIYQTTNNNTFIEATKNLKSNLTLANFTPKGFYESIQNQTLGTELQTNISTVVNQALPSNNTANPSTVNITNIVKNTTELATNNVTKHFEDFQKNIFAVPQQSWGWLDWVLSVFNLQRTSDATGYSSLIEFMKLYNDVNLPTILQNIYDTAVKINPNLENLDAFKKFKDVLSPLPGVEPVLENISWKITTTFLRTLLDQNIISDGESKTSIELLIQTFDYLSGDKVSTDKK